MTLIFKVGPTPDDRARQNIAEHVRDSLVAAGYPETCVTLIDPPNGATSITASLNDPDSDDYFMHRTPDGEWHSIPIKVIARRGGS